jgi:hypothetical protein
LVNLAIVNIKWHKSIMWVDSVFIKKIKKLKK